jgi:hypothetical protein
MYIYMYAYCSCMKEIGTYDERQGSEATLGLGGGA